MARYHHILVSSLLLVVTLVLLVVVFDSRLLLVNKEIQDGGLDKTEGQIIYNQPEFYEENNFRRAITVAASIEPNSEISQVVVPHHLLASSYTARVLRLASGRQPLVIALVGPNHYEVAGQPISTAIVSWETVVGRVDTDADLTIKFMRDFNLTSQPSIFKKEHSHGAIVPFIKYYYPQTKILPILMSSRAGIEEANKLAQWLSDNLPLKSLVIFSIDFSHNLREEIASIKDKETEELINEFALDDIIKLKDDHVDSPASLVTSLLYAQKNNLSNQILWRGNANNFSPKIFDKVTSYFIIVSTYSKGVDMLNQSIWGSIVNFTQEIIDP